ncbi:hypothetical protein ACFWNE_07715 [Streptomyces goshikiensis]|uniref:hypothetical protein n=1 Tax=Streptomyces goshikiensis TaxID=1942 RepID=UPI00364B2BDF
MTASQVAGACITTVLALILLASWALDRRIKRSTRSRFQLADDEAAATKTGLTDDERQAFAEIIATEFRKTIPHQIRRTEEDQ